MKRTASVLLAGLLALVVSFSTTSCKTTGATGGTDINSGIGVVADCAKQSVRNVAKDHLTEVEANLLVDDWKDQLIGIASNIGEEALSCIIDHILARSKVDVLASKDRLEQTKIERSEEWIAARKVTFASHADGKK